jgi:hypothetical protein
MSTDDFNYLLQGNVVDPNVSVQSNYGKTLINFGVSWTETLSQLFYAAVYENNKGILPDNLNNDFTKLVKVINVPLHLYDGYTFVTRYNAAQTDDERNKLLGETVLNSFNAGAGVVAGSLLGLSAASATAVLVGTLGIGILSVCAGAVILRPDVQQRAGNAIQGLVEYFIVPNEFTHANTWLYTHTYFYALDKGVPKDDPGLIVIKELAGNAGRAVYGNNWDVDSFGIDKNNLGFNPLYFHKADPGQWPSALLYAFMMWVTDNNMGVTEEDHRKFWNSYYCPPELRVYKEGLMGVAEGNKKGMLELYGITLPTKSPSKATEWEFLPSLKALYVDPYPYSAQAWLPTLCAKIRDFVLEGGTVYIV